MAAVRALLRVFARLAVLPYVVVLILVVTAPPTWSAVAYVLGLGLLLGGLATLPDAALFTDGDTTTTKRRRPRGLSRAAVVALLVVAVARGMIVPSDHGLHVELAGSGSAADSARWIDRIVDESDISLMGTRVLFAGGMLHDDASEVPPAMRAAYAEMRREHGDVSSPLLATSLGLQRPSAFDLVLVEPPKHDADRGPGPRSALIFLHGFAGNFDLPCWQMARAVAPMGVATACPSTTWIGDWQSAHGDQTLRRTVEVLRARGFDRFVLAGLSNGGYGAAELAPRLRGTFAGLILVSGAPADAPSAGVPTLVIHGTKDTMASVGSARAYAANTGARFVALDAGHFAMLVRAEQHDRAVRDFVADRVGAARLRADGRP
jgi:predicted alpha/beta hydrolase family esterase